MKTLAIQVPDEVYNDALAFTPSERIQLVAVAFSAARRVASNQDRETRSRAETRERLRTMAHAAALADADRRANWATLSDTDDELAADED